MQRYPEGACPRGAHDPEYREYFKAGKMFSRGTSEGLNDMARVTMRESQWMPNLQGHSNWRYVTRLESYPNGNKRKRRGFAVNCMAPDQMFSRGKAQADSDISRLFLSESLPLPRTNVKNT
jgi:hypothetical protein